MKPIQPIPLVCTDQADSSKPMPTGPVINDLMVCLKLAGLLVSFNTNPEERVLVTPAQRGRGNQARVVEERSSPAERRASMTWAQRLKRVFNIDVETCSACGGTMKVIACIEDPLVIKQILDHLEHKAEASESRALPVRRAPPVGLQSGLFDRRC